MDDKIEKNEAMADSLEKDMVTEELLEEIVENSEESIEAIRIELDAVRQEKEAIFQRLLVSEADMKNLRRRTELDLANAHKFALEKFVKELLPCIDALELEINALNEQGVLSEELQKFKEGSELTYRMLLNACEKFGVKQVDALGKPLNPEYHQAITMLPNTGEPSNTVVKVMQNGYLLNDRLLRAAQVIVAQ